MFISLLLVSIVALKAPVVAASKVEAEAILQGMEKAARDFRNHIEDMYKYRCNPTTLTECANSSYNDCSSIYPNSKCFDASKLIDSPCGNGNNCNGTFA